MGARLLTAAGLSLLGRVGPAAGIVALGCVLAAAGCRKEEGPAGPDGPVLRLSFTRGSSFAYETWQLDQYGQRLPGSNGGRVWRVTAVGQTAFGYSDVVIIQDLRTGSSPTTIYIRTPESGDIYQYGYCSELVRRLQRRHIPPAWDRIYAGDVVTGETWAVGVLDTLGGSILYSSREGEELLFDIVSDSVRTLVKGHLIQQFSSSFDAQLWLSDSPSAFLEIRQEVFPTLLGVAGEVSTLHTREGP